jgi:hypothetical protein
MPRIVALRIAVVSPSRLPLRGAQGLALLVLSMKRHPVMNARACDHHDNGIRAWVVKSSDDSRPIESSRKAKHD